MRAKELGVMRALAGKLKYHFMYEHFRLEFMRGPIWQNDVCVWTPKWITIKHGQ